ncbi:TetR/AcrR family transcriptional regulator [Stackebrandtia sp.]|uniref:TetR/AcrR family transcriptional regulator n=1 Tax=Stackebrandtia sp. TaxID=2023065 RepID=UPI0032C2259D
MAVKGDATRARFIEAARTLVEAKGYHGTGLNEVLAVAGAPRGSFYHHFPRGKDQLIGEALAAAGREIDGVVDELAKSDPAPAALVTAFLNALADRMTAADYAKGCPIATVALEVSTADTELGAICGVIYDAWQDRLAEALRADGRAAAEAEDLAGTVLALIEGALVLARAKRSRVPVDRVGRRIAALLGAD